LAEPSTLFWDVGGVLLSNGWDRHARRRAAEEFDLEWDEFQDRHELVVKDFETGRTSLDQYLACTVFHRERGFTRDKFEQFMFAQSEAYAETLAIVEQLAGNGRYLLATLNNESLELNRFRIERFGLKNHFDLFLSSCFLGVAKPDEAMYRVALHVTHREPDACVFIDDRDINVETAAALGIHTIRYEGPEQLRRELKVLGIALIQTQTG
jgi:putative hydrolase of the HAD superfamily